MNYQFNNIEEAIADFKKGKIIIVSDDEDRENEGDFVMSAELATAESINFMAKHGRGLICTPINRETAHKLKLNLMVERNNTSHSTAFTVSIDSAKCGTGISAYDRYLTINDLANNESTENDFLRPGHIFPLIAKEGGVIERAGHTEAAVDLTKLSGLAPVAVICEIMNEDGSMSRVPDLFEVAKKFNLKFITIKDLIKYRLKYDLNINPLTEINFPSEFGNFKLKTFQNKLNPTEHHIAIYKGEITPDEPTLVRVHSECFTGDVLGSKRCDCGEQLRLSLEKIEKEGKGVLLYLRQEGRGIGLINKIKAYELQDMGHDTVSANLKLGFLPDLRDYGMGAQILKSLNVGKMRLMTNNPKKIIGLKGFELEVVERIPLEVVPNDVNRNYLETKKNQMGHLFSNYLQ